MNIDKIVKLHATKLRIDHLTGNLSEMECTTFLNNFLKAINKTSSCKSVKGEKIPTFDEFIDKFNLEYDIDNEYFFDGEYFDTMGLYYKYAEYYEIKP